MSNDNLKRVVIASSCIILIIIVALMISFGINRSSINNLIKEAEAYIKEEDYSSASSVYSKLISKTGEEEYKKKKKELDLMTVSANHYKLGMDKIENREYMNAIKYFKRIDEEDEIYYNKAQEQLQIVEDEIISEAETAISENNTYLASSILNDYIKIVGESEKASTVLASIDGAEVIDNEVEKEVTGELPENAEEWIGKTFEIKSGKANIREEAKLNGKVVTTIAKGGTIMVEEILDDGERIWCYGTITSAKTGETFKAWISSKNL
ncbi:SH3 domain-containing protein [Peptostreptococcaceae bacterium OttesenSCG-928-C18]|nr:SH3 domain-containing protein [Peptostreptococcaceae bacterium OttesenSCG-928-C18]